MADQDMLHTAEVLKAALPYIGPRNRTRAEIITKLIDLLGSLKALSMPDNLAACGYEGTPVDVEGLLHGIRPVCNNKEKEFVDRILNIFQVKRMYEMYNNLMSTMNAMQEFGGFDFSDQDVGDVASNFSGTSFESIFNSENNNTEDGNTEENFPEDGHATMDTTTTYSYSDGNEAGDFNQLPNDGGPKDTGEGKSRDSHKGAGNNKMFFEMLKSMVPPEQLSTFENLSMVLNSMSYDSNSKPVDSEENNNG